MKRELDPYSHPAAPLTTFRVVTLPQGISPFSATPAILQVKVVQAVNALAAQSDPAVEEVLQLGYRVVEVSPGAGLTALERDVHARAQRAAEDAIDPVPADLRGVNTRPPIGIPRFETMPATLPPALPTFRRG